MATIPAGRAEPPFVLALDLGSSSLRAIVYDRMAREVEGTEGRSPTEWTRTADRGVEADPDALLDGAFRAIDRALAGAGPAAAKIRAVGTSTLWHSVLGIGLDGRPVTPLLSWADERSAGAARRLRETLDEETVRARTGVVFHPSYLPARLLWLRTTSADVYRRARTWMSLGEYLTLRCFGRTACSLSMASGTGLLDQRRCAWDAEVLAALGLTADHFPPLADLDAPQSGLRPEFARRWPALTAVPWVLPAGDGALSNLGAGCTDPTRAALSLGTSGAIRVLRAGDPPEVPRSLWVYRLDRRRVLTGGAVSNGGSVHRWITEHVAVPPAPEIEAALGGRAPDAHGLVLLPFLSGERAPDWPLAARGAIVGLTMATGPLDLVQAALEAVAFRLALVWNALRAHAPEIREIVASGGAVRSRAWIRIIADVLGHAVIVSDEEETSSRGAALVALETLGGGAVAAAPQPGGTVVEPDPRRHARYRAAVERHRQVEAALAPLQDTDGGVA